MQEGMSGCGCTHHKMVPLGMVLIGLSFLLQGLGILTAGFVAIVWPVILILIGLSKMCGGMCKCCSMKK